MFTTSWECLRASSVHYLRTPPLPKETCFRPSAAKSDSDACRRLKQTGSRATGWRAFARADALTATHGDHARRVKCECVFCVRRPARWQRGATQCHRTRQTVVVTKPTLRNGGGCAAHVPTIRHGAHARYCSTVRSTPRHRLTRLPLPIERLPEAWTTCRATW